MNVLPEVAALSALAGVGFVMSSFLFVFMCLFMRFVSDCLVQLHPCYAEKPSVVLMFCRFFSLLGSMPI